MKHDKLKSKWFPVNSYDCSFCIYCGLICAYFGRFNWISNSLRNFVFPINEKDLGRAFSFLILSMKTIFSCNNSSVFGETCNTAFTVWCKNSGKQLRILFGCSITLYTAIGVSFNKDPLFLAMLILASSFFLNMVISFDFVRTKLWFSNTLLKKF